MIDRRWIGAVLAVALVACSDGDAAERDGRDGVGTETGASSASSAPDEAVADGETGDDADTAAGAGEIGDDSDTAAGTGDDSDTAAGAGEPALGTAPTTTLPDCPALILPYESGWPYTVPRSLQPTVFAEEGLVYRVAGTTNDPESVLVQVMDLSLPDFVADEPVGDADEIVVEFSSPLGVAELAMADADGDACWDAELSVEYLQPPADGGATAAEDEADGPDGGVPVDDDPLDGFPSIGSGSVVTARGTFAISVTRCDSAPVAVTALAPEGELVVAGGDDGRFEVSWTYEDGVEISDDDATRMGLEPAGGSFVADGEGPDGPETVIVEYRCDDAA